MPTVLKRIFIIRIMRRSVGLSPLCGVLLLLFLGLATGLRAQSSFGVAYYDVGGLYDTIPSPFYPDPYIPSGERRWSSERYEAAVERFAAMIDSLSMPLVGLFGVENEEVAIDLVRHSRGDYAWVHETQNRRDGRDFLLLYQGDRFSVRRVDCGSGWMSVEGVMDGNPLTLLLTYRSRYLDETIEELLQQGASPLIVMGEGSPSPHHGLREGLAEAHRSGRGNRFRRGMWCVGDNFWMSPSLEPAEGDIFIRHWLLDRSNQKPLPLYEWGTYRGGYGVKLPVFIYLRSSVLEN